MFTYITKQGETIYLAKLCFFKGIETPFIQFDEINYLATTREINKDYPEVGYIYIDKTKRVKKEKFAILPLWFPISQKPIKVFFIKVNKKEIEQMLRTKANQNFLKKEFERLKNFFVENFSNYLGD